MSNRRVPPLAKTAIEMSEFNFYSHPRNKHVRELWERICRGIDESIEMGQDWCAVEAHRIDGFSMLEGWLESAGYGVDMSVVEDGQMTSRRVIIKWGRR